MKRTTDYVMRGGAIVVVGFVAMLLSACQTSPLRQADGVLTPEEVRQLFVGNTVESYNLNTRLNSFTYYHPDGTAVQERLWKRRQGRWSIEGDGKICLAFGKRKPKCRHIVRSGKRYYKVRAVAPGERRAEVAAAVVESGEQLQGGDEGDPAEPITDRGEEAHGSPLVSPKGPPEGIR